MAAFDFVPFSQIRDRRVANSVASALRTLFLARFQQPVAVTFLRALR
jgi:hypothetical protein